MSVELPHQKKNKLPRRIIVVVILCVIAAVFTLQYAKHVARKTISQQLTELNVGQHKIGNVSVGLDGVTASDIEFLDNEDGLDSPWLTVERLSINHPILELAGGVKRYAEIEFSGVRAKVDVSSLALDAPDQENSTDPLGLSDLKIPADLLKFSDVAIELTADGKKSVVVDGVDLTLTQQDVETNSPTVIIEGSIGDLLDSAWEVRGSISPDAQTADVRIESNEIKIATEQWRELPGIPDGLDSIFTADGKVPKFNLELAQSPDGITLNGAGKFGQMAISLPEFDLPIDISAGDFDFDAKEIEVSNLVAMIDGQGVLTGKSKTTLNAYPILTNFETKYTDVPIRSIGKLVPAIPDILSATGSGSANGSVSIERSTRTTVNLTASTNADDGFYGKVAAKNLVADVRVEDLVFNEQHLFESVSGVVVADADIVDQPIELVLQTFELDDFQSQMQFDGLGTGKLNLELPLASPEDLASWKVEVRGGVREGKVSGQKFVNTRAEVAMIDGVLRFQPITALAITDSGDHAISSAKNSRRDDSPIANPSNGFLKTDARKNLSIDVSWPVVETPEQPADGVVRIVGSKVPGKWLKGLLLAQVETFNSDTNNAETENLSGSQLGSAEKFEQFEQLAGSINFDTRIALPAAQPEKLADWVLSGTIQDSLISANDQTLSGLASQFKMDDGQLYFANVSGNFLDGKLEVGQLNGSAKLDLKNFVDHELDLVVQQIPLEFVVSIAGDSVPAIREQIDQLSQESEANKSMFSGLLNAKVVYQNQPAKNGKPNDDSIFDVNATAAELMLAGNTFRDFKLVGSVDSSQIRVNKLTSDVNRRGKIDAEGHWSLSSNSGGGTLGWQQISLDSIAEFSGNKIDYVAGTSNGRLNFTSNPSDAGFPFAVNGTIGLKNLQWNQLRAENIGFDVTTLDEFISLENFRNGKQPVGVDGQIGLKPPYAFNIKGKVQQAQLSQITKANSLLAENAIELTGVLQGHFDVSGQLENFEWKTNGKLNWMRPTFNGNRLADVEVDWEHLGNDWKKSKLVINAFDGVFKLEELSNLPERVKVKIEDVDAEQMNSAIELPSELSGRISGEASLNDWSLSETRWADLKLKGSSVIVGPAEFGDFQLDAEYRKQQLSYDIDGEFLGGRLTGKGATSFDQSDWKQTTFPVQLSLNNTPLDGLYRGSNSFNSLRPLTGKLNAKADFQIGLDGSAKGDGRVGIREAKWDRRLLTRLASVRFKLANDRVVFDDVKVDLKRGTIKGRTVIPLRKGAIGSYEVDIRSLDLDRLAEVFGSKIEANGLLDGRIDGQIGRQLSGRGFVGVHRATVSGIAGQSFRVPIQFLFSPKNGNGKIDLRRTSFRIFDGNAAGAATLSFGRTVNVDVDLKVSNVDTKKMISTLSGVNQSDQGKLTGRFQLKGRGVRTTRDLDGSFRGNLQRVSAFKLPVLTDLARLISGGNLQTSDYKSDEIVLLLDNNRVKVQQLNFSNPLVKIAITGDAYLDGRLDFSAAARVDRLQQPSLLDELAGSPLARLNGSPAAIFAQAAEFLSERVVFLRVAGTFDRPQVRIDTSQQLREETIRYFLRGSQILPNELRRDN